MEQHVILRKDLSEGDLLLLIRWMANERVYQFLNEHQQISSQLKQVYDARLPVFTPLFNRNGPFYILCTGDNQPIGFLRMAHAPDNAVEMVVAIGEKAMWGQGYGRASLAEAEKIAFFDLRREKMIARIYNENARSRQMFIGCGFKPGQGSGRMTEYQLTFSEYLQQRRRS